MDCDGCLQSPAVLGQAWLETTSWLSFDRTGSEETRDPVCEQVCVLLCEHDEHVSALGSITARYRQKNYR
jgi:hypothetical protein